MENQGIFQLAVVNVTGEPIGDEASVRFLRSDGLQIGDSIVRTFTAATPTLTARLPAFPQVKNLRCDIVAKKYRQARTPFFTLDAGATKNRVQTLIRDPEKFTAKFVAWQNLPGAFDLLRRALAASPDVEIEGRPLESGFTSAAYDAVSERDDGLFAKAALLNIYAKVARVPDPLGQKPNWFSFVERIVAIRRERVIALVSSEAFDALLRILDRLGEFPQYKIAGTGEHRGNIPPRYRIAKIKSVKTRESEANLQLTIAKTIDALTGREAFVLDADLDESGRLLPHLFDVLIKHPIIGGTNPFDIHEILLAQAYKKEERLELGYELIARTA